MRAVPGVCDLDNSLKPGKPELQIKVDREKASRLGITVEQSLPRSIPPFSEKSPASTVSQVMNIISGSSIMKLTATIRSKLDLFSFLRRWAPCITFMRLPMW